MTSSIKTSNISWGSLWHYCGFEVIVSKMLYFLVFAEFHIIKVIRSRCDGSIFIPKIRKDTIDMKPMNLKTKFSLYFIFGKKNGVLLTESSTSLKDFIVNNSLQALTRMSKFIENCILNTMGRSYLHDHKKRFHC